MDTLLKLIGMLVLVALVVAVLLAAQQRVVVAVAEAQAQRATAEARKAQAAVDLALVDLAAQQSAELAARAQFLEAQIERQQRRPGVLWYIGAIATLTAIVLFSLWVLRYHRARTRAAQYLGQVWGGGTLTQRQEIILLHAVRQLERVGGDHGQ